MTAGRGGGRARAGETVMARTAPPTFTDLRNLRGIEYQNLVRPMPERKRKADRVEAKVHEAPARRVAVACKWTARAIAAFDDDMQGCEAADLGPGDMQGCEAADLGPGEGSGR